MKRKIYCFFLVLICASCRNEAPNNLSGTPQLEINDLFPNFPDQPFLDINFQDDYGKVAQKLITAEYEIGEDGLSYVSKDESIKIILPESDNLTDFKLLFFNKKDLFYDDLSEFLDKNGQKSNKTSTFSVFNFGGDMVSFKITLFRFENLIRLHYIPKSWH